MKFSLSKNILLKIHHIIHGSHYEDADYALQLKTHLLSYFLLTCVFIGGFAILLYEQSHFNMEWRLDLSLSIQLVGSVLLFIVYLINRGGLYGLAVFLTLFIATITIFILSFPPIACSSMDLGILKFLLIPILLCSVLLSLKNTILFSIFINCFLIAAFVASPFEFQMYFTEYWSFIFLHTIVILIVAHQRNALEKSRLADIMKKEGELKESLREKTLLLQEIHHRVKNNLQVITSLLNLQAGQVHDQEAKDALTSSKQRVHAMAMIHTRLYSDPHISDINFEKYIESIANDIQKMYSTSGRIQLTLDLQSEHLDIDTAVPLGLIVNELLTNALKHAFKDGSQGEIHVVFKGNDKTYLLEVHDNGQGLSKETPDQQNHSLGLKLVRILTKQLEGTLDINSSKGTHFSIQFPKSS
ncbi:sensor histidine kinase [bacterium]